ncbi:hypothetical protein VKT23_008691 [Stygiomarasmius scandens]|uniref:Zinc finger protein n=1 Tax=Marasmiellus scandens TaxID=2682957 RepID=A0ABR1JKF2_9AGAR
MGVNAITFVPQDLTIAAENSRPPLESMMVANHSQASQRGDSSSQPEIRHHLYRSPEPHSDPRLYAAPEFGPYHTSTPESEMMQIDHEPEPRNDIALSGADDVALSGADDIAWSGADDALSGADDIAWSDADNMQTNLEADVFSGEDSEEDYNMLDPNDQTDRLQIQKEFTPKMEAAETTLSLFNTIVDRRWGITVCVECEEAQISN